MSPERKLEEHESGLRALMAKAAGRTYVAYRSLEEALADASSVLIIEGDYGGQIYLTCPVRFISATEKALRDLALSLDARCWRSPDACRLHYEPLPIGSHVPGGMGGGAVVDGVWIHEDLRKLRLAPAVEAVIRGERAQLA